LLHPGKSSIQQTMQQDDKGNDDLHKAQRVHHAVLGGYLNYRTFLSIRFANDAQYLMDQMMPLVRYRALECMVASYRPTVPVHFVTAQLQTNVAWLQSCGCEVVQDEIDCKATKLHESTLEKRKSLI